MNLNSNIDLKKTQSQSLFLCSKCNYYTNRKSDYTKHLSSLKHTSFNENNTITKTTIEYNCKCGKKYTTRQNLWRHKQKCENKKENINEEQLTKVNPDLNLIMDFVKQQIEGNIESNKQNQELQKQSLENQMQMFSQMMDFMKQQCTTTNNINNGTINNNTQFNLQVYLNETCKNAMNIDQFIEYLQPTLQELEDTARLGYVEGITRIIMRGLKDLEENERPFHCSDLKRETMFVKNNNDIWEKETDEKPQLLKVVKAISRKNFCNVNAWQKAHPTWKNHDSKHNDQYNQILINSTSGSTEEEQKHSYEKIIKNIVKETVIDKSKKNK